MPEVLPQSLPPGPIALPGRYWLVVALPWPSPHVAVANAAYAIAAPVTSWSNASGGLVKVLTAADAYASRHPRERVVWFSDLTRWLDTLGLTWAALGVDWPQALDAPPHSDLPGSSLDVDRRTHLIVSDSSRHGVTLTHVDGHREQVTEAERARLRGRMRDLLAGTVVTALGWR